MTMRKGLPAKLAFTDADDTRYDFRNDVVCNADATARQGITSPFNTALIGGTATMNVTVAAFSAVAARDNGAIKLANDGSVNVLVNAAPASNARITLICARQDDASGTVSVPDGDNLAKLYTIDGAASASPAAPALPAGSVEIGRVLVTAGNTNTNAMTITQAVQYTAAAGGIVPFKTAAQLALWTTANLGQRASVNTDTTTELNGEYQFNGTTWVPTFVTEKYLRINSVTVTVAGGTIGTVSIPASPFPTVIEIDADIQIGNTGSAGATGAPVISSSGGTLTSQAMAGYTYAAAGGWYYTPAFGQLVLPANTAGVLTVINSAIGIANGAIRTRRHAA